MFKNLFRKKQDLDDIQRRAEALRIEENSTREVIDTWYNTTVSLIKDQYERLTQHMPMGFVLREKLEADPQLKARIQASLQLDDEGHFDCLELEQLREQIERENDDNDIVLQNEYAAIAGKVALAYGLDRRFIEHNPDAALDTLTPYYDLDFVKSYLKI